MKNFKKIAISAMIVLSSVTAVNAQYFMKTNLQAGMIQEVSEEIVFKNTITKTDSGFASNYIANDSIEIEIVDKNLFDKEKFPREMFFVVGFVEKINYDLGNGVFGNVSAESETAGIREYKIDVPDEGFTVTYKSDAHQSIESPIKLYIAYFNTEIENN